MKRKTKRDLILAFIITAVVAGISPYQTPAVWIKGLLVILGGILLASHGTLGRLRRGEIIALGAVLVAGGLLVFTSPRRGASLWFLLYILSSTFFFMGTRRAEASGSGRRLGRVLSILVIIVAIDALVQALVLPSGLLIHVVRFFVPAAGWENLFETPETGAVRAFSLMGNPITLSFFLIASLGITTRGIVVEGGLRRILPAAATAAAVAGILFTYSRGGYISLVFFTVIILLLGRRTGLLGRAAAIGAAAVLVLLFIPFRSRLGTMTDPFNPQVMDRLEIWATSLNALSARPVSGWGLMGYGSAFMEHITSGWASGFVREGYITIDAHSEYLTTAVECGLPGLGILLTAVVLVLLGGYMRVKRETVPNLAALAALALGAFFSTKIRLAPVFILLLWNLAALFPAPREAVDDEEAGGTRLPLLPAIILLFLLLIPFTAQSLYWWAVSMRNSNRDEARPAAELIADWFPDEPRFLYLAGRLDEETNDMAGAERRLRRLRETAGLFGDGPRQLVRAAFLNGKEGEGMRILMPYLERMNDPEAAGTLAADQHSAGRRELAREIIEFQRRRGSSAELERLRSGINLGFGDTATARSALRSACALGGRAGPVWDMGIIELIEGRYHLAWTDIFQAAFVLGGDTSLLPNEIERAGLVLGTIPSSETDPILLSLHRLVAYLGQDGNRLGALLARGDVTWRDMPLIERIIEGMRDRGLEGRMEEILRIVDRSEGEWREILLSTQAALPPAVTPIDPPFELGGGLLAVGYRIRHNGRRYPTAEGFPVLYEDGDSLTVIVEARNFIPGTVSIRTPGGEREVGRNLPPGALVATGPFAMDGGSPAFSAWIRPGGLPALALGGGRIEAGNLRAEAVRIASIASITPEGEDSTIRSGEPRDYERAFRNILMANPFSGPAHLGLAAIRIIEGRGEEALDELAMIDEPSDEARTLAAILGREGIFEEGEERRTMGLPVSFGDIDLLDAHIGGGRITATVRVNRRLEGPAILWIENGWGGRGTERRFPGEEGETRISVNLPPISDGLLAIGFYDSPFSIENDWWNSLDEGVPPETGIIYGPWRLGLFRIYGSRIEPAG